MTNRGKQNNSNSIKNLKTAATELNNLVEKYLNKQEHSEALKNFATTLKNIEKCIAKELKNKSLSSADLKKLSDADNKLKNIIKTYFSSDNSYEQIRTIFQDTIKTINSISVK